MADWHVHEDLLVFHALRMRFHRIGLLHWKAGTRLRSWEAAPLHACGPQLLVPCDDDEALWLGAWTGDDATPCGLALQRDGWDAAAQIALPAEFQLTALYGAAGSPSPVTAGSFHLRLQCGRATQVIALRVLAPGAWADGSGRPRPPPLDGPPPLPPRLG